MAKEPKNRDDLFHDGLKDLYVAEKKIVVALPRMAKAAESQGAGGSFRKT
jgi:ferritin-like metal-binding protein YciE